METALSTENVHWTGLKADRIVQKKGLVTFKTLTETVQNETEKRIKKKWKDR